MQCLEWSSCRFLCGEDPLVGVFLMVVVEPLHDDWLHDTSSDSCAVWDKDIDELGLDKFVTNINIPFWGIVIEGTNC